MFGLEGDIITLPCLGTGDSSSFLGCKWQAPYGQSFFLHLGEYAERGRLQVGAGCRLKVNSLHSRDEGDWSCLVGDQAVVQRITSLNIDTPLKLSAPTSILQQADERATLVCHANKVYESCEWETPYGRTVSFSSNHREEESGRLQYFGFSSMDCGIVIKDIGPRDSGGWTCRISATVANKHQLSADIVRLFVEPQSLPLPRETPRSIEPPAPVDYHFDYKSDDYKESAVPSDQFKDYDAFDYINGDFGKVPAVANNKPPIDLPIPGVVSSFGKAQEASTEQPEVLRTIEEDDGFIRDIKKFGKFGTVRIDRIPDRDMRISTTSNPPITPFVAFREESLITEKYPVSPSFPVFHAVEEEEVKIQTGLNPSELDFLSRISGSQINNRPFRIENENATGFGLRQSSVSGSRFQFGDIHLVGRTRGKVQQGNNSDRKELASDRKRFEEEESHRQKLIEEDAKRQREEEERREKIKQLRVQQIEETRKLQEERERKRLEAEFEKKRVKALKEQKLKEERLAEIKRVKEREERERKLAQELEKQLEREKKIQVEKEKLEQEEKERKLKEEIQIKLKQEMERKIKEERDRNMKQERERKIQEERDRQLREQLEKIKREKEAKRKMEIEELEQQRLLLKKKEEDEKKRREILEEREKILKAEREKQLREEKEKKEKEELEKKQKEEQEKRLREIERRRKDEREKRIREERERKRQKQLDRRRKEERERKEKEDREILLKLEEEKARVEEQIKRQKEKEEEERILKIEEEKARIEEERKKLRDQQEKEKEARIEEERRKILEEIKQKERLEQERLAKLEEEKAKLKEEQERERKRAKVEEEKRQLKAIEDEKQRKQQQEIEERRKQERDRIRQDLLDKRRKENEEARRKKLVEDRQKRINAEKHRQRQAEIKRIQEVTEKEKNRAEEDAKQRKIQEDKERKLKLEKERIRKEDIENKRREAESARKKAEEEERLKKIQDARDQRIQEEKDRLLKESEERRRKEEKEIKEIRQREKERQQEINKLRELQAERDRQLEDERKKIRKEIEEKNRKEEDELKMIREREKEREAELQQLKELHAERARLRKEERKKLRKGLELKRKKEEEEADELRKQAEERKKEIENLRAQQLNRENQLRQERKRIQKEKDELEKQQQELQRQRKLFEQIKAEQEKERAARTTTPRTTTTVKPIELKKCIINPWPEDGNVTCPGSPLARGKFVVKSGDTCNLDCKKGFVTLDKKETQCDDGRWTNRLYCVLPGAMLIVGGRSDTYGVLSSVELVTSGGVCRNIVPNLPSMRWKMIAASIDTETVAACGGINFLGDPKTDCWRLDFTFAKPRWTDMKSLSVPRDAAAWAAEQGKLYVTGGSLGPLSGYTASVEVYDPALEEWLVGPSLTSTRASHCAVGVGNGSIIVTGGYGALDSVQRLDIKSGVWTELPEMKPVRAQHGCALVDLSGEEGVLVVGGDSGGTRLNDVRFLALRGGEWRKIADLNTARWGRPSVGTIGGKITVIGGWDGVKALNTVEYYNEKEGRWQTSRKARISTERRWAAGTQISNKLFPTCVQKRS